MTKTRTRTRTRTTRWIKVNRVEKVDKVDKDKVVQVDMVDKVDKIPFKRKMRNSGVPRISRGTTTAVYWVRHAKCTWSSFVMTAINQKIIK